MRLAALASVLVTGSAGLAQGQCTGCPNASFGRALRVFEAGDRLHDIVSADFDRDGFLDAAVTRSFVGGPVRLFHGNGRGGFAAPLDFPTPEYPQSLVTGDFNRDGFADLAFTFSNRPTIGVLLGGAGGRFGPAVEYEAGPEPWDLVAADFNGDHADDVAVILNGTSGNAGVAILLATGTGAFGAPTTFPDGQYPRDVAAADLNHDGNIDLAITNVNENVVSILLGQGNGSFGTRTPFAVPPTVLSVAVGFFNADAHPDLAVSGGGFLEPAALAILPGNGQGLFDAATVVAPISAYELEVLDFNKDGKDDLAGRWNGVTVLIGNGNGTFQSAPSSGPFARWGLAPGDFNSDGWSDFAVVLQESLDPRTLRLYLGSPSGVEKTPTYPGAFDPTGVTVGDFNHDGRSDLAIGDNSIRFYPAGSVSVLLSLPDGSLSPPATYLTAFQPSSIRNADFNGDGHLDLACANSFEVSILLGSASGSFSSATNYPLGSSVSAIDTADFNTDGKIDLVFSSFYDNILRILLGDGAGVFGSPLTHPISFPSSPVAGDFDLDGNSDVAMIGYRILYGDGTGHFGDVSYVDAGVSVQKFVVSDFNGDGRPDLAGIGITDGGAVLLGQPSGGFGSPLPFPVEFDAYVRMAPSPGDFDLDGKMDLAVLSGGNVSVLRGNGNGTFSNVGNVFVASLASDVITADFNADGRFDLASIRATYPDAPAASDVAVLLNTNCLARRLAVTRNPSVCNLPDGPLEVQPMVKLYDDGDNVVSCIGGTVQASIVSGSGTPGAALGGTTAAPLVAGTAIFGNLSVDAAGDGYVLQFARAGVLAARSRAFRVNAGCKGPFALYALPPCRVLDTRDPAGPWGAPVLAGSSSRRFAIAGRCGIPLTARSIAANLTVVGASAVGHLTLFPAGRSLPLASTINFRAGVVRANNAILELGDAGDVEVLCGMPPSSTVHFVLDVSGYFE